mmetsp:Transcript_6366/g.29092  ORF Transcript_6366/g.29092 Transcript_6366/m.29092 type:complete len:209 (-) Transcript_6366:1869-2495(-)
MGRRRRRAAGGAVGHQERRDTRRRAGSGDSRRVFPAPSPALAAAAASAPARPHRRRSWRRLRRRGGGGRHRRRRAARTQRAQSLGVGAVRAETGCRRPTIAQPVRGTGGYIRRGTSRISGGDDSQRDGQRRLPSSRHLAQETLRIPTGAGSSGRGHVPRGSRARPRSRRFVARASLPRVSANERGSARRAPGDSDGDKVLAAGERPGD